MPRQQAMDELLKKNPLSISVLHRGDVVEGEVLALTDSEALIDVGAKAEGILPFSEFEGESPKVGQKVLVYVLTPESRKEGQILLSLKRAQATRAWLDLEKAIKKRETLIVEVIGHNKGGLIVEIFNLQGFIPFSHLESGPGSDLPRSELQSKLDKMRGEKIKVKVMEVNKSKNRVVLSERKAKEGEELERKKKVLARFKEGKLISASLLRVMPYGLILDLDGVEGLVPQEEISWEEERPSLSEFEVKQKIKTKVLKIDETTGRVILSVKRLTPDPWEKKVRKFKIGKKVKGGVVKITSLGVLIKLAEDVEGLLPLVELPKEKQNLKVGDKLGVKIKEIDVNEHKVELEM